MASVDLGDVSGYPLVTAQGALLNRISGSPYVSGTIIDLTVRVYPVIDSINTGGRVRIQWWTASSITYNPTTSSVFTGTARLIVW